MKTVFGYETEKGWEMIIQFFNPNGKTPMKDADKQPIIKDFFFPKVSMAKETSITGTPLDIMLGTVKSFGDIKVSGFVKYFFIPDIIVKSNSSYHYKSQTGREGYDTIRTEFSEEYQPMKSKGKYERPYGHPEGRGELTPHEKTFPMEYVYTKDGWVPQLFLEFQRASKEEIKGDMERGYKIALSAALKEAKTLEEKAEVMAEFAVKLPKQTREERRKDRPESMNTYKGEPKEIKAADNASTWSYSPKACMNDKYGKSGTVDLRWKVRQMFKRGELNENQLWMARNQGWLEDLEGAKV